MADRIEGRDPGRAVLGLLGIATRAGAVVTGTQAVRTAARAGKIHRVILARDAAAGQRGKLEPLLLARRIPYHIEFSQAELGAAIGRKPVSAVGLSNPSIAERAGALIGSLPRSEDQQGGR